MNRFSEKIISKIKEEKMKPKPRWHFVLMHVFLLLAIVFSIAFGSVAVAIVIRKLTMSDWDLARLSLGGGGLKPIFYLLPYLWLIFVGLSIFVADKLFKQTKTGYRRKSWVIVLLSILLSLNFGYIFYLTKFDRPFVDTLRNHFPLYQSLETKRHEFFAAPDKGALAGKIIEIASDDIWILADVKRNLWKVDVSEATFKTEFKSVEGVFVGVSGEVLRRGEFKARVIGVWDNYPVLVVPSGMR